MASGAFRRCSVGDGFSLIELLIVVATAAVLAALIWPAASSGMDRVRDAKSIANLKAIGGYLFAYSSDNRGMLPSRMERLTLPNGTTTSGMAWHSRLDLNGYVKNRDVFFNPKEKYKSWNQWVDDPNVAPASKKFTTAWLPVYGFRLRGIAEDGENLHKISQPSQFFIVTESWFTGQQLPGYFVSADPAWRVKMDRKGIANTLFADGHVEPKNADYFTNLINTPEEVTGGGRYRVWPE